MKRNLARALTAAGCLMILSSLLLVVYNILEARIAGNNAAAALKQVEKAVQDARQESLVLPSKHSEEGPEEAAAQDIQEPTLPAEMPTVNVEGWDYVGTLRIPALSLELPVLDQWSYEGLKRSPCRFTGTVYAEDLVICGHSYASHFGGLAKLQEGETVTFTTMDGETYQYQVAMVEVLEPTAVEEMTESPYPLSLITSTMDSQARVTVRCVAREEDSGAAQGDA